MTEPVATFDAIVTDIHLESRIDGVARWQIALDSTLFHPESPAGVLVAVSPSGARLEVPVLAVVEDGGSIWHVVDKPLAPGTPVLGRVAVPRLEREKPNW